MADMITGVSMMNNLVICVQIVFLFSRNEWRRMESEQLYQTVESIQNNGVVNWGFF